jgi:hypothetical protein
LRFVAVGVVLVSVFAVDAGGDRRTVVTNAGYWEGGTITGKRKGDIARVPEERKPTVKQKTAAGMG